MPFTALLLTPWVQRSRGTQDMVPGQLVGFTRWERGIPAPSQTC